MSIIEQLGGYERAKEHLNDFNESLSVLRYSSGESETTNSLSL